MIALNQTPEERRDGIMRFAEIVNRHRLVTGKQTEALQQLSAGQVVLDDREMTYDQIIEGEGKEEE